MKSLEDLLLFGLNLNSFYITLDGSEQEVPEVRQLSYNLRPRPHGFLLPSKDDRNFLSRLLYKDMY